jgi:hypothetical protein
VKNEFEIRAYYKTELAMIYSPEMSQRGALRRFNKWLKKNPRVAYLQDENDFTPRQVQQIVEELGEPHLTTLDHI